MQRECRNDASESFISWGLKIVDVYLFCMIRFFFCSMENRCFHLKVDLRKEQFVCTFWFKGTISGISEMAFSVLPQGRYLLVQLWIGKYVKFSWCCQKVDKMICNCLCVGLKWSLGVMKQLPSIISAYTRVYGIRERDQCKDRGVK